MKGASDQLDLVCRSSEGCKRTLLDFNAQKMTRYKKKVELRNNLLTC